MGRPPRVADRIDVARNDVIARLELRRHVEADHRAGRTDEPGDPLAQGFHGDFVITPTADGYVWEIPAGPTTIRYTAVIKDGKWREVGDRIMPDKEPARFFEMNLKRVGDTTWPAGGAIPPK